MKRHHEFNLKKSTKLSSTLVGLEERQEHLHNNHLFKEIPWEEERSSHIITLKTELRFVRWLVKMDVKANPPLPRVLINS